MQVARVNEIELEYDVTGSGEPVLFISPVLTDGFAPLLADGALAGRYRLISYHKRGWAGSTHSPPPVTLADHVADAAALLDHLEVPRAHLVGHSSGAAIALELAVDRHDRVHTLSLLELSLLSLPSAAPLIEKAGPAFAAYATGNPEEAVALFLSAVSGLDWPECHAVLEASVPGATEAAVGDADTFFGIEFPALAEWDFGAQRAAAVTQPVLSVLGAETEPLWVEVAQLLRAWLPQVEECTIEGVGHLLHVQRPKPVALGVADFLRRHPMAPDDAASVLSPAYA